MPTAEQSSRQRGSKLKSRLGMTGFGPMGRRSLRALYRPLRYGMNTTFAGWTSWYLTLPLAGRIGWGGVWAEVDHDAETTAMEMLRVDNTGGSRQANVLIETPGFSDITLSIPAGFTSSGPITAGRKIGVNGTRFECRWG